MQLSHKSLQDWLTGADNKRFPVRVADGHVLLADACNAILSGGGSARAGAKASSVQMTTPSDEALGADPSVRYAVKHWALHLCEQGHAARRDAAEYHRP